MKLDIILPAGGRIDGDFAKEAGTSIKALIELEGSTVMERTIQALRSIPKVGRIAVIGPQEVLSHPGTAGVDAYLPEGSTGPENILRGIEEFRDKNDPDRRMMIVTTDMPFLTTEMLDEFISSCDPNADVSAPLVSRGEFEGQFPGAVNEFVKLKDGEWTMGCAFLINPSSLMANRTHLEQVFSARKSQLAMARLLGFGFILRFLTGKLTIPHIERRCGQILGCCGAAVRGCAPELAFDIDGIEDYRYAVKHVTCGTTAVEARGV